MLRDNYYYYYQQKASIQTYLQNISVSKKAPDVCARQSRDIFGTLSPQMSDIWRSLGEVEQVLHPA